MKIRLKTLMLVALAAVVWSGGVWGETWSVPYFPPSAVLRITNMESMSVRPKVSARDAGGMALRSQRVPLMPYEGRRLERGESEAWQRSTLSLTVESPRAIHVTALLRLPGEGMMLLPVVEPSRPAQCIGYGGPTAPPRPEDNRPGCDLGRAWHGGNITLFMSRVRAGGDVFDIDVSVYIRNDGTEASPAFTLRWAVPSWSSGTGIEIPETWRVPPIAPGAFYRYGTFSEPVTIGHDRRLTADERAAYRDAEATGYERLCRS